MRIAAPGYLASKALRSELSSKNARTMWPSGSAMPQEPCSHKSAISRSRVSASDSISSENIVIVKFTSHEATRYFPTDRHAIRPRRQYLHLESAAQRREVEPDETIRIRCDGLDRRKRDAHHGRESPYVGARGQARCTGKIVDCGHRN